MHDLLFVCHCKLVYCINIVSFSSYLTRMVGLYLIKFFKDMFSAVDRIPACDRQTDRQTSCESIVRATHMRRGNN